MLSCLVLAVLLLMRGVCLLFRVWLLLVMRGCNWHLGVLRCVMLGCVMWCFIAPLFGRYWLRAIMCVMLINCILLGLIGERRCGKE